MLKKREKFPSRILLNQHTVTHHENYNKEAAMVPDLFRQPLSEKAFLRE